jgi:hypothetical protein
MATRSRVAIPVAVLVVALLVGAGVAGVRLGPTPSPSVRGRAPTPPAAVSTMTVERVTTLAARPACDEPAGGFVPRAISIPGVARAAAVVTPPRDSRGIPGTPPLTTAGKSVFAWDTAQGTRPGDDAGNVLLNAHTWPDGSALGNRMLAQLFPGGRVVVEGDGIRLCYEVSERVEVLATEGLARYYTLDGPPQLAMLACSGRRLGPGSWEKRTVWFASPVRTLPDDLSPGPR